MISAANEVCYFYLEKGYWYLASDSDTRLGGPFASFDDLLRWGVEKEFVEPKPLWAIIDEREVHSANTRALTVYFPKRHAPAGANRRAFHF